MVGIFSRFTANRGGHRRTQSSVEQPVVLPAKSEATSSTIETTAFSVSHRIETASEFKPIERPAEPLDYDQPIQCPLAEPSILNDGRIWKERVSSSGVPSRTDLPVMQEQISEFEFETPKAKPPSAPSKRLILPSVSAPEHSILKLLEECNVSRI